jgi:hypothetical protein
MMTHSLSGVVTRLIAVVPLRDELTELPQLVELRWIRPHLAGITPAIFSMISGLFLTA